MGTYIDHDSMRIRLVVWASGIQRNENMGRSCIDQITGMGIRLLTFMIICVLDW